MVLTLLVAVTIAGAKGGKSSSYSSSSGESSEDRTYDDLIEHSEWEGWDATVDDDRYVFFMADKDWSSGFWHVKATVPEDATLAQLTLQILRWKIRYYVSHKTVMHHSSTTTWETSMEGVLTFIKPNAAVFNFDEGLPPPPGARCCCFKDCSGTYHRRSFEADVSGTITRNGKSVRGKSSRKLKAGNYDIPVLLRDECA